MSTVPHLIAGASFDPPAPKLLGEIFDEVWASIAWECPGRPDEREPVRPRLANIVLDLAKDGQLGALEIIRTASRLMREAYDLHQPDG
jgi:hypothetical protein